MSVEHVLQVISRKAPQDMRPAVSSGTQVLAKVSPANESGTQVLAQKVLQMKAGRKSLHK